jgi:hypothetical protein
MSKKNIIKFTLDPDNPPPLTSEQLAMLDELKKMPDSEIDYSDIPPHDFTHAKKASRRKRAVSTHNP